MIHIQTTIYDSEGGYFFMEENKSESVFQNSQARVQRDKLLDNTTYVKKHGYSVGDRTFTIISDKFLSKEKVEELWRIHTTHLDVFLSCHDGFFLGVIESIRTDRGKIEISFIPYEKYA